MNATSLYFQQEDFITINYHTSAKYLNDHVLRTIIRGGGVAAGYLSIIS